VPQHNYFQNEEKMKYSVLDTFAGAGGFSLGFALAGAKIIGAIEIDKWASETFQLNHPDTTLLDLLQKYHAIAFSAAKCSS
jgi:site-specific DNA-cytosine methylase